MEPRLDLVSRVVVDLIRVNGYEVQITKEGEVFEVVATYQSGEKRTETGGDLYQTVFRLAERIGVRFENA